MATASDRECPVLIREQLMLLSNHNPFFRIL